MLDPKWLTERQTLFEKFCLPSVMSQTNKNFEWILIADVRTPEVSKKVLKAYPATVVYGDFENLPVPTKRVQRPKNRFHRALQLEVAVAAPLKEYLETKDEDYIKLPRKPDTKTTCLPTLVILLLQYLITIND